MCRSKYKKLVLIGNGFDRWRGLPTSYDEFRNYYLTHIEEVMHELRISKLSIQQPDGSSQIITPVELVYGDPFHPKALSPEFFWTFERSLDKLDDQQLNLYFGRSEDGLQRLRETVSQAQTILRQLFSAWIREVNISTQNSGYCFDDDCFFVNFNYTDTLEKHFGIDRQDIYYIHGEARQPESIIFGHATHPETALKELTEQHFMRSATPGRGLLRYKGLYAVEDVLYQTDKHVADRIDAMCLAFMKAGLHIEDIEQIYVLGHSFGVPDIEYFNYLDKATRRGADYEALSAIEQLDKRKFALLQTIYAEDVFMEELQLNILYASHHRERKLKRKPMVFPPRNILEQTILDTEEPFEGEIAEAAGSAVHQRFLFEQAGRTQKLLEKIAQEHGMKEVPHGCHSVFGLADYLSGGHAPRKRNALWHISYFTPEDKRQINKVMRQIKLKRFELYEGIDQCLSKCGKFVRT